MKIRKGFVSNSSSSSYTCEVCGETVSGMDIGHGYGDEGTGMFDCENGHTVCTKHAIGITKDRWSDNFSEILLKQYKEKLAAKGEDTDDIDEDDVHDSFYSTPAELCPICQMTAFRDEDMLAWCLKKLETKRGPAGLLIKTQYNTYQEFMEDVKDGEEKTSSDPS